MVPECLYPVDNFKIRDVLKMPGSSKEPLYPPPLTGVPHPFTLNGNNSHKEREVNQSHEIDFHFYHNKQRSREGERTVYLKMSYRQI